MGLTTKKLAIDLGTSNTRVHVPKKGIAVNEPTAIAIDESNGRKKIVAVGAYAHEMRGKTPDEVSIITPMKSGVIANYDATAKMLSRFINQSSGRLHFNKPVAMITVSSTSTSTEKKAMIDAGVDAGLQNVYLIDSAVAAGLGAGLAITEPIGTMVVDIGAGTTEVGVFSLGGIVAEKAARVGGNDIDEAIRLYARRELGVNLSAKSVFRIKSKFLNLSAKENNSLSVTGQAIAGGLPKKVTLKQKQLSSYVDMPLEKMVRTIRLALEKTAPDVVGDIVKHGLVMTGGSAQLKGLGKHLSKKLNLACVKADNPELAGIKGANLALTHLDDYRRSLLA